MINFLGEKLVNNCAEVFATNNALLGGADIDNIFLNTRNFGVKNMIHFVIIVDRKSVV